MLAMTGLAWMRSPSYRARDLLVVRRASKANASPHAAHVGVWTKCAFNGCAILRAPAMTEIKARLCTKEKAAMMSLASLPSNASNGQRWRWTIATGCA